MEGTVFDIKELAVFDGPGIRTTVFMKGCPLRCQWCHNPEGLSFESQLMVSPNGCLRCGRCTAICEHPDNCVACGKCVRACPLHLRRIVGTKYTPEALAKRLLKDQEYLAKQGGGVTFSGGEPTAQGEFLLECLKLLRPMHRAIETSGYCRSGQFRKILEELDYIIMDIKLVNEERHRFYTGAGNRLILENLEQVKESGKPFRIRIPVIPDVNDTQENYQATAALLAGAKMLEKVELLPYHKTAGAKYSMVGREYTPEFDPEAVPNLDTGLFLSYGIRCEKL